jgi:tRNA1(Val) A37 N6-methylase TrmN6
MSEECSVRPDETVDDFSGLKVIQKKDGPRFSLDAAILAEFATVRKGDEAADLGTG